MNKAVCVLCWNDIKNIEKTANRLLSDNVYSIFLDQNSNDGTYEFLEELTKNNPEKTEFIRFDTNIGNSCSRNVGIDIALKKGFQYIGFLDGDIIPLENSFSVFEKYLSSQDKVDIIYNLHAACTKSYDLALESGPQPEIMSNDFSSIENRKDSNIFPTHYSLSKSKVFEKIRLPEFFPFNLPGWGWEDNVLNEQSDREGFVQKEVSNVLFLHLTKSSYNKLNKSTRFYDRYYYWLVYNLILNDLEKDRSIREKIFPKIEINCSFGPFDKNRIDSISCLEIKESESSFSIKDSSEKEYLERNFRFDLILLHPEKMLKKIVSKCPIKVVW